MIETYYCALCDSLDHNTDGYCHERAAALAACRDEGEREAFLIYGISPAGYAPRPIIPWERSYADAPRCAECEQQDCICLVEGLDSAAIQVERDGTVSVVSIPDAAPYRTGFASVGIALDWALAQGINVVDTIER